MKILLVNPEVPETFWSFKRALKFISRKVLLPPVGLLTVAAMLPSQWQLKLLDMNASKLKKRHIEWADYVFIYGMVVQKSSIEAIIDKCKALNTPIVAGGPLFTSAPEMFTNIDHLVLGEAEVTLPGFLAELEAGKASHIYRSQEKADMSQTPTPKWSLLNMKKYAVMGLQYSRGCPYNCDFCDVTNLLGRKVRTKSTEQMINELESLYQNKWRGDVFFVDDNFIGKRRQIKQELLPAVINWMNNRNHPFRFNTQASIDIADDEELMKMLVEAGFESVFIGIESPSAESLTECHKTQNTNRDLLESVKKIQRFGLQVQGGFILGFDCDTPGVFNKLINLIQNAGIVTSMVGLLNAPPGTALYNRMKQENRLTTEATGDNMDTTMNFLPRMDAGELKDGYRRVLKTIYSQKYFTRRIKTFLQNYNLDCHRPTPIRIRDIKAFIHSMWKIGIIERGRIYYWKLLFWAVLKPKRLPLAVRLSIYGFHFRKTLKNIG